jgi:hypothetical protein
MQSKRIGYYEVDFDNGLDGVVKTEVFFDRDRDCWTATVIPVVSYALHKCGAAKRIAIDEACLLGPNSHGSYRSAVEAIRVWLSARPHCFWKNNPPSSVQFFPKPLSKQG